MVFYVVLKGALPTTALERLKGEPLDLSGLPPLWEQTLSSGLGLLPAQRPQHIEEWLLQMQTPAASPRRPAQCARSKRRHYS